MISTQRRKGGKRGYYKEEREINSVRLAPFLCTGRPQFVSDFPAARTLCAIYSNWIAVITPFRGTAMRFKKSCGRPAAAVPALATTGRPPPRAELRLGDWGHRPWWLQPRAGNVPSPASTLRLLEPREGQSPKPSLNKRWGRDLEL